MGYVACLGQIPEETAHVLQNLVSANGLTRYLSIVFLNILTLLACTQSVDKLFHTLMVLCENENFLTSNLLCFFTSV